MIKKLSRTHPPLVVYTKHRGAVLTEQGELVALEIIRHHRLLELYLHEVLGYDWDEVHDEADRLEHVISEAFEDRIARALGEPERDPHGDPIPTRDLQARISGGLPLTDLSVGDTVVVERVLDARPETLRLLAEVGLVPGARVTLERLEPEALTIRTGNAPGILSQNVPLEVARRVLVIKG